MTFRIDSQNTASTDKQIGGQQQSVFSSAVESAETGAPESSVKLHEATWQAAQLKFTLIAGASANTTQSASLTAISESSKEIELTARLSARAGAHTPPTAISAKFRR